MLQTIAMHIPIMTGRITTGLLLKGSHLNQIIQAPCLPYRTLVDIDYMLTTQCILSIRCMVSVPKVPPVYISTHKLFTAVTIEIVVLGNPVALTFSSLLFLCSSLIICQSFYGYAVSYAYKL